MVVKDTRRTSVPVGIFAFLAFMAFVMSEVRLLCHVIDVERSWLRTARGACTPTSPPASAVCLPTTIRDKAGGVWT